MAEYPLRSSDLDVPRAAAQTRVVYPTRDATLFGPATAGETTADVHGRTPHRGATALITGFLLVVIGASVIGLAPETWRALVNDAVSFVGAGTSYVTWQPIHDIGRVPLNSDAFVFGERAQTLLGAAAVVGGGSVLGAGFFPALLSSALIGLIAGSLMILTGVKMTPASLIVLAMGLGYALHAPAGATSLRARGV